MTEVRRHQRQTASGKTTTVRQHERNVGGQAWADRVQETTQRGWQVPAASETPPPRDDGSWWDDDEATPAGDWWAEEEPVSEEPRDKEPDGMLADMRDWRSRPEPKPSPAEPMSPEKEKLLGCDTPEGRAKFDRLRAYREAGYDGPLDSDNRIPDPDDPANQDALSALAYMRR